MHVTAVVIGNTAACLAAVAAAAALYFAGRTVREAKLARLDAEAARKDAVAERREAERARQRRRLERIGELVDDVYMAQYPSASRGWESARNVLRHALVGLGHELPKCIAVVNAESFTKAIGLLPAARDEIETALQRIHVDDLAALAEETQAR